MEAFQTLSRGGARFDKHRFKADVELFTKGSSTTDNVKSMKSENGELPDALDFFKYARNEKMKSTTSPLKKNAASVSSQANRKYNTADEEGSDQGSDSDSSASANRKRKRASTDEGAEGKTPAPTLRKRHRVTTKGTRVPAAAETFRELEERYQMPGILRKNLEGCGYEMPTGIQSVGVPIMLEGRDLAAISPTGTGKTMSYLLPVFSLLGAPAAKKDEKSKGGVRALVLSPTRELAAQIYNEALKLAQGRKWRVVLFSKATAATLKASAVRSKVDIIISTPLRMVASVQAGELELDNVRHLILDEVDRLLDTEFLGQTQEIVALCTHPQCQKAVFSATLPANAENIALGMLNDPIRVVVGLKDTPLPNIKQTLTYVAQPEAKLPTLLQYLTSPAGYTPPIIVFTSTQARATSLLSELLLAGVKNAEALHAGMTRAERDGVVKRMRKGEVWVLVCTEVMARGMDFGGVRGVINFDWPESVQSYVHRIGRTGRAGRDGIAITYFTDEDAPFLKSVANVIMQSGQSVPDWMVRLPKPGKKKKEMGKAQRARASVGPKGENVGRAQALKKREMIAASRRRKDAVQENHGFKDDAGSKPE